jgi:hypothetical protein
VAYVSKRQTITALKKQSLNNCPRETEPKRLPARKSKVPPQERAQHLLTRNKAIKSARKKIAKLNGFFAPKREERRIPPHIPPPRLSQHMYISRSELPQLPGQTRGEP